MSGGGQSVSRVSGGGQSVSLCSEEGDLLTHRNGGGGGEGEQGGGGREGARVRMWEVPFGLLLHTRMSCGRRIHASN